MDTFSKENLHDFIVKAKSKTYAAKGPKSLAYRPDSHDLQYQEGAFAYLDSYFGGTDFLGQEVVYFEGKAMWVMNYYGRITDPTHLSAAQAGSIIMESLSTLYENGRFLGGYEHQTDVGNYVDSNTGDLTSFQGVEWIEVQGQKAYELVYHGGLVKT